MVPAPDSCVCACRLPSVCSSPERFLIEYFVLAVVLGSVFVCIAAIIMELSQSIAYYMVAVKVRYADKKTSKKRKMLAKAAAGEGETKRKNVCVRAWGAVVALCTCVPCKNYQRNMDLKRRAEERQRRVERRRGSLAGPALLGLSTSGVDDDDSMGGESPKASGASEVKGSPDPGTGAGEREEMPADSQARRTITADTLESHRQRMIMQASRAKKSAASSSVRAAVCACWHGRCPALAVLLP